MTVNELINVIEEIAPPNMACDWDNTGFQAGRRNAKVNGIYLALDATQKVIEDAAAEGCNFLLSHHPLIFRGIKTISDDTSVGRRLLMMAEKGIAYYAAHTSYDAAPGMMADRVASRLRLTGSQPIELSGDGGGIGRIGMLPEPMSAKELGAYVRDALAIPCVLAYIPESMEDRKVSYIGVLPGSGHDEIPLAISLGAEAYITGDISYHAAVDAMEDGLIVIDAGHYGTEWVFMEDMKAELEKRLHEDIPIIAAGFHFPGVIC